MSKMTCNDHTHTGFTIVELLIVIVVIAILAAISIVAYTGIQDQARNAMRMTALSQVNKGLQLYYVNHDSYPNVCFDSDGAVKNPLGSGYHCEIEHLRSSLVPEYMEAIPDLSSLPHAYRLMYTIGPESASGRTYALAMRDFSASPTEQVWGCKYTEQNTPDWFFGLYTPSCHAQ